MSLMRSKCKTCFRKEKFNIFITVGLLNKTSILFPICLEEGRGNKRERKTWRRSYISFTNSICIYSVSTHKLRTVEFGYIRYFSKI